MLFKGDRFVSLNLLQKISKVSFWVLDKVLWNIIVDGETKIHLFSKYHFFYIIRPVAERQTTLPKSRGVTDALSYEGQTFVILGVVGYL